MLVKIVLFLLNAALATAILHLTSQVHLPSFVKMLPKYLKDTAYLDFYSLGLQNSETEQGSSGDSDLCSEGDKIRIST